MKLCLPNRSRRAAIRRRFACILPVVCIVAWWCASAPPVRAQQTSEFILRASPARIQEIAARYGLTVVRRLTGQDVYLVRRDDVSSTLTTNLTADATSVETTINDDPDVVNFEQNAVVVTPEVASALNLNGSAVSILDSASDATLVNYFNAQALSGYVNQPATTAIRLSAAHGASGTGAGIVAIIDTGVDPRHPLLAGSLVAGYDFVHETADASEWTGIDGSAVSILDGSAVSILDGHRFVTLNGSTVAILDTATATALNPALLPPAFGHGTMVAGLVHLVAPSAKIMPLKAFTGEGTGTVFNVVRAIYFAVENGARVINMSFSAESPSTEIARAINFATSRGVICVASAGNLGQEALVYPGALRNVVGVGSTTSADSPLRSSFSNFGDALVSLGAPGEGIITTYPGGHYAAAWGTSFSTPLVAGGAALLVQIEQSLDQDRADDRLGRAQQMAPGMGRGRLNLLESVLSLPDRTAPNVNILTPAGGAIFGSVMVSASASDNVSVAGVRFLLDGNPLGAEDTSAPYELMWPTGGTPNGSHLITALARDAAGNESSSVVSVSVLNDTMPPTVTLTSPTAGATVSGLVTVSANASDDREIAGVQFRLNGLPLGAEDTDAPYELTWSTTTLANGAHTLTAVARDGAGKTATAAITVSVANDSSAPTVAITSPAVASVVEGTVTLMAVAADDIAIAGVQFQLDGANVGAEDTTAPYQVEWHTAGATNGNHTVTAVARDAAGNQTTATGISVTVSNDTSAPVVALTSPTGSATLTGTIVLTASAADDFGVAGVQFQLDGANLGAEDTTAPYELAWPTTTAANSAHTLTAIARDATAPRLRQSV